MKIMKRLLGVAAAASAMTVAFTGAAAAQDGSFSGNVALTSDYVFRGISQSDGDIAIQGGLDYTNDISGVPIYIGTWGSSIDFGLDGTVEVDVYGGVRPVLGPVTFDLGVIGYLYPGMSGAFDADYWELKVGASLSPAEGFTIGGNLYWSPDFTFTAGTDADALYAELTGAYTFNDMFSVSAGVANQSVDVPNYYGSDDNYTTWNVGGTLSAYGFGFDLRYYDTDVSPDLNGPGGDSVTDGRVVGTIKRAL
jgi:uncharacterized protein (TIGR02001 family)